VRGIRGDGDGAGQGTGQGAKGMLKEAGWERGGRDYVRYAHSERGVAGVMEIV